MKITPWVAVVFGLLGYPIVCIVLTNLLAECFTVPSRNSGHLLHPLLTYGVFVSGPLLGCVSAFIVAKARADQKNYARTIAIATMVAECLLLIVLWIAEGGGWLDGMTYIAIIWPLLWCAALFFSTAAKTANARAEETLPPIAAPL